MVVYHAAGYAIYNYYYNWQCVCLPVEWSCWTKLSQVDKDTWISKTNPFRISKTADIADTQVPSIRYHDVDLMY